jgi:hypothetical protein
LEKTQQRNLISRITADVVWLELLHRDVARKFDELGQHGMVPIYGFRSKIGDLAIEDEHFFIWKARWKPYHHSGEGHPGGQFETSML